MEMTETTLPGGARLTGYLHDPPDEWLCRGARPCVLVLPGGAYRIHASHEAEPVAMRFYAAGYQAFVLRYALFDGAPLGLRPLLDASAAALAIREHRDAWRVDPARLAVCGFSAGGHCAASLGSLWNHPALLEAQDTRNGGNRPDALVLCYPVITARGPTHSESIRHLAGDGDPSFFSLEEQVGPHTPPVFLWHTADDPSVPVENALLLLTALRRAGVPFESHIYGSGPHGLGLADAESGRAGPHVAGWPALCLEWLNALFRWE